MSQLNKAFPALRIRAVLAHFCGSAKRSFWHAGYFTICVIPDLRNSSLAQLSASVEGLNSHNSEEGHGGDSVCRRKLRSVRHTGFVAAQRAAERLAAVTAIRTTVTPLFRLATAPSARPDDSQTKNIFCKYLRVSTKSAPAGAVRPDTYSSCTWLVPPSLRAESRLSNQRLLVSGLSEAYTPAKAQQHRQNVLQRLHGLKPGKPRPDASRSRCGAFLWGPHRI